MRRLTTLSRTAAAGAAALLALSLAACSSGGGTASGTPAANTSSVSGPASSAASSAPATSAAAADRSATELATAVSKAMAAKKTAAFAMEMTAGGQTLHTEGAFRFTPGDVGMRMTMDDPSGGAQTLQIVLVKDALYIKMPEGQAPVPGKSWLKASAQGQDPISQQLAPMFSQMQKSLDPSSSLDVVAGSTQVKAQGTETVDGVKTTKYLFTVDVAKAAASATGEAKKSLEQMQTQGVSTLDYTLWVDGQDLARKFQMAQQTKQGKVEITGTYSKWGENVDIAAPPAAQTFSADELGGAG